MGRLHSNGKGISASAVPYSRSAPSWLKTTPDQVVDQICKLAKKGATPSQIGVILRDSHGIAQVKVVTGMLCCVVLFHVCQEPRRTLWVTERRWKLTFSCALPGNRILRILKSSGTVSPI